MPTLSQIEGAIVLAGPFFLGLGVIGNGLEKLPWAPAQKVGAVLAAISVDFVKLFGALTSKKPADGAE